MSDEATMTGAGTGALRGLAERADAAREPADAGEDLAVAELLVEEVSIDGMCGVY